MGSRSRSSATESVELSGPIASERKSDHKSEHKSEHKSDYEVRSLETPRSHKSETPNFTGLKARNLLIAALSGSFLFGFNVSLLNSSLNTINSDFQWCGYEGYISCTKGTWYGAAVQCANFLGGAMGSIMCSKLLRLGCRRVFLGDMVLFAIGIIGSALSEGFMSLFFDRFVVGVGVGIASVVVPTFISEIAPSSRRGLYGSMHQLTICMAQLFAVLLGVPFSWAPQDGDVKPSQEQIDWVLPTFDKIWWRVMLGLGILPVMLGFVMLGVVYNVDTPLDYFRRNEAAKGTEIGLALYRDEKDVQRVEEFVRQQRENERRKIGMKKLFKLSGHRRAAWVAIMIASFQQLTGINAFMAASNKLFIGAGLWGRNATWASVGMMVLYNIATLPASWVIDRLGRRTILMLGDLGMAISVTPAAIMYWAYWSTYEDSNAAMWCAIVGTLVFLSMFAWSFGPVTWIYIFECFPLESRDAGSTIAATMNWLLGMVIVLLAIVLDNRYVYTIFMVMSYLALVLIWLFVRETKDRVLGDSPYVQIRDSPSGNRASIEN